MSEYSKETVLKTVAQLFDMVKDQQSKIDELQNIIDELKNHIEINFDEDREDDQHSYWSGYNQALREIKDIG